MRNSLRKVGARIGLSFTLILSLLTVSTATHTDKWIPSGVAEALHIGNSAQDRLDVGPMGPVNLVGQPGEKGEPGEPGPSGARGMQGKVGRVGPVGPIGAAGPRGPRGTKGDRGDAGLAGPVGPVGPAGAQGMQGVEGARGPAGPAGPAGLQGAQGAQGIQGPQGLAGATGATGATGESGVAGPMGPVGPVGPVGPMGPVGATGATGASGLLQGIYGSYLDTTTQLNSTPGQPIAMKLNTVVSQRQVSIVDTTKVRVAVAGTYNIAFSAQMFHNANEATTTDIWLRVNGSDLPLSNTQVTFEKKDFKYVAAWNFMVDLNANDYVQLMWFSNDSTVRVSYSAEAIAPVRPAIPSLILTINQVG